MSKRLSPREMRFLELYFSGLLMKDAARAAGYRGSTPQALCNTGRAILNKFSNNPEALFCRAGPREERIFLLLDGMLDGKSTLRQLTALKILAKHFFKFK